MMFKKIAYEGDIFRPIAVIFLFESIYGGREMWIHIIIDASNAECGGGGSEKKGSAAKSRH